MLIKRHIPENATTVKMKSGGAVFYLYQNRDERPCVVYYIGKRTKGPSYRFKNEAERAAHIEKIINNVQANAEQAAARRAERNKPHNMEEGLILYTSWGYDQTNVEYYEVIDVPSPCYVVLQQIGAPLARGEESFMSGSSVPNPDNKIGEPIRRKVDMSGSRPSVKICNVVTAWIWDGKEKRSSWYA